MLLTAAPLMRLLAVILAALATQFVIDGINGSINLPH